MSKTNQPNLAALRAEEPSLKSRYAAFQAAGLALDMTRGKPCAQQLDLSLDMLTVLTRDDYKAADGTDCRNYGGLDGLPEAKALFAEFLGVQKDEVIIGGNSSLALMHDTLARAMSHGVPGGAASWTSQAAAQGGKVKFICPAPGYDRHFALCEHFGIEMITVDLGESGLDIDAVERLVASDELIKGLWLVPKYGNPSGLIVSNEVIARLARMKCAAPDFRVYWDDAYTVHHLTDARPDQLNLQSACKAAGTDDRVLLFGSTSKISFSGSGIAVVGGSAANMAWYRGHLGFQTIGPDKLNQLRHLRFFKDMAGIEAHMKKHAAVIKPKFDAVASALKSQLEGVASWTTPTGGYFVSVDTPDGCAKRTVQLAKAAGVSLTGAGATFPYGKDPRDRNIRVAPTLPSLADIEKAMDVFCVCVKLAALEKSQ
ncbi:MAG: hypothetical protein RJA70_3439 [Pseudomonadota bacterium]|jgi:DNA-binding transcriptional MocR family regulator